MPEEKTITVFKFDELSERMQEKIINAYQEDLEYDWWSSCFDDFEQAATILGIEFDQKKGRNNKGDVINVGVKIWFSGFYHQGSGLCYDADYTFNPDAVDKIRDEYPNEYKLHNIADTLFEAQQKHPGLSARITSNERYHVINTELFYDDEFDEPEDGILDDAFTDFQHWMYKKLETEYEYLTSADTIKRNIEENDDRFDEYGRLA